MGISTSKLKTTLETFFALNYIKTIYFNFHYLPFKQAIRFPFFLFNVKLKNMGGTIVLDSENIKRGMIRLGRNNNSFFETTRNKLVWEMRGSCIFKGECTIGNNSAIVTGNKGSIEFGDNVLGAFVRICSYKSITIGENTRFSWEIQIIDTDFHETINIETGEKSIPTKEIKIGKNNWIGNRVSIMKGTVTPDFCIVGASSLLNKKYDIPLYSLIAGVPAKLIKTGLYRDLSSHID